MIKKFAFTILFTILSPVLLLFSLLATGGGHGNFEQLVFLFPWMFCCGFLLSFLDGFTNRFTFGIFLAILQFFVYGAMLDWFRARNEIRFGLILVTMFHVVLAILSLLLFFR